MSGPTYTLLSAAIATGAGSAITLPDHPGRQVVFEASGTTSAGAGSATVKIYGSRTSGATVGTLLGTITLTLGTTVVYDGFAIEAPWTFVWADVTAISGTDATVTVRVGT